MATSLPIAPINLDLELVAPPPPAAAADDQHIGTDTIDNVDGTMKKRVAEFIPKIGTMNPYKRRNELSYSRAILISPTPMSRRSFLVGMADSRRRNGRHFGLSWKVRLILALLCPNSVPFIFVPPCMNASFATVGILHDGTMIGNVRNTDRNLLKNLVDLESCFLLLFAGCNEMGMRGVGEYLSFWWPRLRPVNLLQLLVVVMPLMFLVDME
ncbi:hypothetical protein Lal_00027901 [Lupinus albus]|nr:hypothetical protein Lal_00027901 [Lupinus albus]